MNFCFSRESSFFCDEVKKEVCWKWENNSLPQENKLHLPEKTNSVCYNSLQENELCFLVVTNFAISIYRSIDNNSL